MIGVGRAWIFRVCAYDAQAAHVVFEGTHRYKSSVVGGERSKFPVGWANVLGSRHMYFSYVFMIDRLGIEFSDGDTGDNTVSEK